LDAWAYREDARLDFSNFGKPTDNAHIFESREDAEEALTS